MTYQFTPAAERAIRAARRWSAENGRDDDEVSAAQLLLGLLDEPECRAAVMLARRGIERSAVCQRWPALRLREGAEAVECVRYPSPAVETAVFVVRQRLGAYPAALEVATEHLLMGLALSDGEVGRWLADKGVDAEELAAEVLRIAGYDPAAVAVEPQTAGEATPGAGAASKAAVLRVVDAAGNRGREGLRTLEDYARFVLDDGHLTVLCKQLRHELVQWLDRAAGAGGLACRDTVHDVGVALSTGGEQSRSDATAVARAAIKRVQESLRTLEEFGKLLDAEAAEGFKQLRYRAYTIDKALWATMRSLARLGETRLYVLAGGGTDAAEFERLVAGLVAAGVHAIQLRDKSLDDRSLVQRARQLRRLTAGTQTLAIVNDRPDVAVVSGADGVHVGQEELPVKDVRSVVGPDVLIGVSTHSLAQAEQAVDDGADYLGVGPTFPSRTKQFPALAGLELLEAVAGRIRLPAFAIGGIDLENVERVLATGIGRIAVGAAVIEAADPAAAARALLARLESGAVAGQCCGEARP